MRIPNRLKTVLPVSAALAAAALWIGFQPDSASKETVDSPGVTEVSFDHDFFARQAEVFSIVNKCAAEENMSCHEKVVNEQGDKELRCSVSSFAANSVIRVSEESHEVNFNTEYHVRSGWGEFQPTRRHIIVLGGTEVLKNPSDETLCRYLSMSQHTPLHCSSDPDTCNWYEAQVIEGERYLEVTHQAVELRLEEEGFQHGRVSPQESWLEIGEHRGSVRVDCAAPAFVQSYGGPINSIPKDCSAKLSFQKLGIEESTEVNLDGNLKGLTRYFSKLKNRLLEL